MKSSMFLLGAATSAHQVEGNNIHSDYWTMENMKYSEFNEKSGLACDHYNRYKEDIAILKQAGLNAYRFSIEWARVEPEKGYYDEKEIKHYIDVIDFCNENGIEPIITMHHFTSPCWVIKEGGWENKNTAIYFANYVAKVVSEIKDKVHYICTINEANMGIQVKAISKRIIAQMLFEKKHKKDANVEGSVQVGMNFNNLIKNMNKKKKENKELFGTKSPHTFISLGSNKSDSIIISAHLKAKEEIKKINPNIKVGITLSLHDIQVLDGGNKKANNEWNDEFTHYIKYLKDDDFIGVQNYTRSVFTKKGLQTVGNDVKITQMGYEFYPKALGNVVSRVYKELGIPILVTENGIATTNDKDRVEFINKSLEGLQSAIKDGANVIGYMHWSLLDNFEWQKGYSMQFGLVSVNRDTLERTPKESLTILGGYNNKF